MKNEQKQKAEKLYFQTNMSKSQIAEAVGVNRRTIMLWVQEGNWDKLRMSARHLPSLVAEKCYYVLDKYVSSFLSNGGLSMLTFQPQHADTMNKLASTIKKIKNRNTSNETMEMFNFFLPRLKQHDPKLAEEITPHVEAYLAARIDKTAYDFLLDGFNEDGSLPFPPPEFEEARQDNIDAKALSDNDTPENIQTELTNAPQKPSVS